MAKKTDYLNANLTYEDTFSKVVETINEIQYDLATVVVTTSPVSQPDLDNGGATNGNTHINGILSANTTTAIDGIRGGTVSTSDTLHVLSDASFEGANVVIQSGTDTYIKDEIFISANAEFTGNNVTINVSRTLSATAANNAVINAPDIDVDSANVTIGSTGADQVTINSDVDMTANVVIGSNTEDQFTVEAVADFNATINVDGDATLNANTTIGSDSNDLLTVEAVADFNQSLNVDGIVTLNANVSIGDDTGDELLSVFAAAEFNDNVTIGNDATDNLTINANTVINNQMTIGSDGTDTLLVNSDTTFSGNVIIGDTTDGADDLTVNSNTTFTDDVVIEETLVVNGNATLGDDIATDTVTHTANTVLGGELHVTGQTKLNGNATVGDANTDIMTVEATTTFKADVTVGDANTDTLTVNSNTLFTDDVDIEKTLTVDDNITLGANGDVAMTVNADTTFNDDVAIVQTLTVDGNVQLGNNTTGDTLTVTAVTDLQANTNIGAAATDQLTVNANTNFNTDVHFDGDAYLNGNTTIGTDDADLLTVNANTVINNQMTIGSDGSDTFTVNSNTFFTDDVDIEETLTVDGNVTLGTANVVPTLTDTTLTVNSNTTINYDATVNGTFKANGDTDIGDAPTDTLDVNATADFNASVNIDGVLTTTNSATIGSDENDTFTVNATANLVSNTTIGNDSTDILAVNATSTFNNNVTIGSDETDDLTVNSNTTFTDDVKIEETLTVDGDVTLNANTSIGSDSNDLLTVNANTDFTYDVTVDGDMTLNANVVIGSDTSDLVTVKGDADFEHDVDMSATLDVTGAVSFANTLGVTGASTFANTVLVTGSITGSNTLTIEGTSELKGDIDLGDANTDTITFTGEVDSNIIPSANATHNLGSADDQWNDIYIEDAHVTANTNTGKVVINQADAEIIVSTLDDQTAAHGSLTVQFDHANTEVANVETVIFTSTTVEPVANEGISLGTSSKNFKEGYIADSHIDKVDTDIVSSNTITVQVDDTTDSATIEIHLADDGLGGKDSVVDITADSTNVTGPFTVSGAVTLGDAETDAHTINGDTTFAHDVVVQKTFTTNGSVTLGDAETDIHTINGDTTFTHDVGISKTLTVTSGATFNTGATLGTNSTVGHIVPSANTANTTGGDATNGWSNLGSTSKYFRNIYVDTIVSPNFRIRDLNDTSTSNPVAADDNKVYAYNAVTQLFELQSVAALAGEGITLGDLNDITITSLTNNDILFVTDSTSNSPFTNAELEINLITDAVTQDKGTASYSIGVGEGALGALLAGGDYNTALGKNALSGTTTGDNNVGLGSGAGSNLTTGSGNIYIGKDVSASAVDASNEIVIGASSITDLKLGTILTANTTKLAIATDRQLIANTAALAGTLSLNNSDSLAFESGKHWITYDDGGGDFNIRVSHYDNASGHAESTEAGYAFHDLWTNVDGFREFRVSDAALAVGDTDDVDFGWNTQIKYDTNSVELYYQGAKTFETVSGGVDIVGVLSTTGSATIGGDLTVTGNLEVQGTRTFINTTTLEVDDNIITLNKNYTGNPENGGAVETDAGIEVERGDATNVSFIWDESENRWAFTNDGSNYNTLPTDAEQLKFKTIAVSSNGGTVTNIIADLRTDTLNLVTANVEAFYGNGDVAITTSGLIIEANATSDTITLKHADTSSILSPSTSGVVGSNGVSSITVDEYGHVTAATSATYDNYGKWVLSANGSNTDIDSQDTLTIADGDGINSYITATDTLNIVNVKPFDKLVLSDGGETDYDIANSNKITFAGDTDITITASNTSGTDFQVSVDHDDITRTNTTTGNSAPSYDGTFSAITSLTTSNTGHVTNVNTATFTLPSIYSLPTASATVKGGVKVGTGLTIDGNAVLTVDNVALHRIILTQTSNSNNSFTASTGDYEVPFNTREHYDSGVYTHDINTNSQDITVDVSGVYTINYMVGINPSGAGRSVVEAQVYVNNSPLPYVTKSYERGNTYGDEMVVQQTLPPIDLAANDVVTLKVRVTAEDATSTYIINPTETTISMLKVGTEAPGNTWRPIDDIPSDGQTTTSISSNWAYDHRNDDGTITAGSKGESANTSVGYLGTFAVPRITYDGSGHITAITDSVITLPAQPATPTLATVTTAGSTTTNNITVGQIDLKNSSPTLDLIKSGASVWLGGVGSMTFRAETNNQLFGEIVTKVANTSTTAAEGYMEFYVAQDNAHTKYLTLDGSSQQAIFNKNVHLNTGIDIVFEGGTSNSNETTLTVANPTADRTITLPNATGTVALTSDLTSFLTTESDTLATVTGRGNSTTNSIEIGDLNFNTNANTVMDVGGEWWFQGFNSVSNNNGLANFIVGNSSYDWDNNARPEIEVRQYGYSSAVGNGVSATVDLGSINFTAKQQQTATGGDSTAVDITMSDITSSVFHTASGKEQQGKLRMTAYTSSNTTSGSTSTNSEIMLDSGVINFYTNVGSISNNVIFDQASTAPKTIWKAGGENSLYIQNDTFGTKIHAIDSSYNNGHIELSADNDVHISPTSGLIKLNDGATPTLRGYFDLNTADTIKIYTGASTLNTTFSNDDITVEGDVNSVSDERTKENIETIDNALDVVTSIRGVYYNKIGNDKRKVGVIAQEVEEVLPHVVATNNEDMKSVDYGKMVGVLIEAIKEQQGQIEALKAEIQTLKK